MSDCIEDSLYCSIGVVSKTKGLKGSLRIILYEKEYFCYLENNKIFFINEDGFMLPCFINSIASDKGSNAIVAIDNINSIEQASKLVNKEILALKESLASISIEKDSFINLVNFHILDSNKVTIGKIQKIIKYPQQYLASLIYNNKEVLIPLIEEFIIGINYDKKIIEMNLPEGLLDI